MFIDLTDEELLRASKPFPSIEEAAKLLPKELAASLEPMKGFGMMLRHPLVYCVPFFGSPLEITNATKCFEHKSRKIVEAKASGDVSTYVMMHERPYRLKALLDMRECSSREDFWREMGSVWTDSENISANKHHWQMIWNLAVQLKVEHLIMGEEDALLWHSHRLKKRIEVFRGCHRDNRRGFAWTVDEDKAQWFANRYGETHGTKGFGVYRLSIKPESAIVMFARRSESEIILRPDFISSAHIKRKSVA